MKDYWRLFFLLVWICTSFIISILIFTSGLLLHREELPYRSSCHDENTHFKTDGDISAQHCTSSDLKVILLVIDALRYDFIAPAIVPKDQELPFQNKLTVVHDILRTKPKRAKLFKFIADAPTATMQGIKALTTGGLSTFIDIGSNFASTEIKEDNLIDALRREHKKAISIGDDVWTKLYPNRFVRSYPFDSFNVWDLDTVDNGVRRKLFPELRKNDWDLLIGHFLGVDHCGHRYGPVHPEMHRKLNEMNDVLRMVTNEIQNKNVLLFVIGDHGMTSTGDHGGDTENEVTSGIFVYSPVHDLFSTPNRTEKVNQVDLLPTLSTILGISIPFSNIGSLILECIPSILLNSTENVSSTLWRNVEQITNYIRKYSTHNSQFTRIQFESILKNYTTLKKTWPKDVPKMIEKYQSYMTFVLDICKEVWVTFTESSIIFGLICTLIVSIFAYVISDLKTVALPLISKHFIMLFSVIFAIVTVISVLWAEFFSIDMLTCFLVSIELFSVGTMLWICTQLKISIRTMIQSIRCKIFDLCWLSLYMLHLVIPFSNSFILEEPKIVLYIFITMVWFTTRLNTPKLSSIKELFSFHLILTTTSLCFIYRVVLGYAKCRGEEDYECQTAEPAKITPLSCLIAIISFIYFASFHKIHFRKTRANRLCLIIGAFVSLYWICESSVINIDKDWPIISHVPGILLILLPVLLCVTFFDPLPRIKSSQKTPTPSIAFGNSFTNIHANLGCMSIIILGQLYAVPVVLMNVALWFLASFASICRNRTESKYESDVPWINVILWSLSSIFWFYTTGHNASFSSIQWNAAFLIEKNIGDDVILPGALIGVNTFISQIIHSFLLMLLLIFPYLGFNIQSAQKNFKFDAFQRSAFTLVLRYLFLLSIRLFFTMLAAFVLRRHLMMWGVFAPKFIFEALSFGFFVIPFSLIGYLFTLRVARRIETTF